MLPQITGVDWLDAIFYGVDWLDAIFYGVFFLLCSTAFFGAMGSGDDE